MTTSGTVTTLQRLRPCELRLDSLCAKQSNITWRPPHRGHRNALLPCKTPFTKITPPFVEVSFEPTKKHVPGTPLLERASPSKTFPLKTKEYLLKRIHESKNPEEITVLKRILEALLYHPATLNLANLKLATLPTEISLLQNLEELDVSGNYLTALQDIEHLKKLKKLDVSFNTLSDTLPPEIGFLQNLEELNVSGNRLTTLQGTERLKKLKKLDVSQNRLGGPLPTEIRFFKDLEELNLANNLLMTLQGLENLPYLRILHVERNQISEFSDDEVKKLRSLTCLTLIDNPLKKRIMIYGLSSCQYQDVAKTVFKCFTVHQYMLGDNTRETRPRTELPIYKIPTNGTTAKVFSKAGLVNLVLDNLSLARSSPPEKITHCLFCIASDKAPFDPQSLIQRTSITNSEMKRAFKLCYDPTLPEELQEVARKTFFFCQVHIEKIKAAGDGYPKSWYHYLSLIHAPWDDQSIKEALNLRLSQKPDRATKMWRMGVREKYEEMRLQPTENAVVCDMTSH